MNSLIKNYIKKIIKESFIEEDYPESFDMNFFKTLKSFASRKKLQNLFLENRQQYLFHETLKVSANTFSEDFIELNFKLRRGIGFGNDYLLLKNISNYEFFSGNVFHKIKIIQNVSSILFYQLNYNMFKLYIQFLNLIVSFFIKKLKFEEIDYIK
jgi:hypothetical protein